MADLDTMLRQVGAWKLHKPRVWRLHGKRTMCTVSPSLVVREWLWTVDRSNRQGRSEVAHGRARTRSEAKAIGERVLALVDLIEVGRNRKRYEDEAARTRLRVLNGGTTT